MLKNRKENANIRKTMNISVSRCSMKLKFVVKRPKKKIKTLKKGYE